MNVNFDACSLINLEAGQVLAQLASTPTYGGHIGPLVRGECRSIEPAIAALVDQGKLRLLPDLPLTASAFGALIGAHNLGIGETECLANSQIDPGLVVSCDDGHARAVLRRELGPELVTGTIGLLARAVCDGLIPLDEAYASYLQMVRRGAFLPALSRSALADLVSEAAGRG